MFLCGLVIPVYEPCHEFCGLPVLGSFWTLKSFSEHFFCCCNFSMIQPLDSLWFLWKLCDSYQEKSICTLIDLFWFEIDYPLRNWLLQLNHGRYIRRNQLDAGCPLFETESLKWPGFVEFIDMNCKILIYSVQER